MKKLEDTFVLFEIASILKSKGFDEICLKHYNPNGVLFWKFLCADEDEDYTLSIKDILEFKSEGYINAPQFYQVMDWFREKHNIEIYCPNYYKNTKGYKPEYEVRVNGRQLSIEGNCHSCCLLFPTYYEAISKGIDEALKLI